ncbi:protein timeless homolog isoform X2 [Artemia franciscana]|uniref:protein timeless homolog isoform X2 n=1 Tax=Artemia franciscana TaxID=6661 RepID=UPI0032DAB274
MRGPTRLDPWQEAQVTTSCTRIGNWAEDTYQKDIDCQESLKELLRYLRRDNDYFSVRCLLGEYEIIQKHLIPLVITYGNDKGIFNFTLRLLVNLTTPPLLLWREEIPADKDSRSIYLQLKSHQSGFKEAFTNARFWETVSQRLQELLNLDWDSRQEDDKTQIEMILILVRNTLHIPPSNEDLKRTEDDASSHDQVIWALHESGFYNLMLYIASSDSEQHLCMHILEILSKMLKDSNAEDLATAGKLMSASRREESTNSLVKQKLVEDMTKSRKNFKLSTRHSRFGGIYSVKGVKSVGERDATVMKPNFDPGDLSQDQLKDNLVRHRTMANDESYYLWAVRFFSQFNRIYGFKLELISETLNVDSFHYVQSCIELYMNNLHTDKRNIDAWNQRMQNAMSTYKELLLSMVAMDNSKEKPCLDLSQHIKSHIFYQMEYRELCLQLLQHYKPFKFSKTFRRDLIESTHIFFKLLEKFAKSNRHIVIQKKKGIRKKSDKKKNKVKHEEKQTEEQISQIWEDMREELEMILGGVVLGVDEAMPFDPASDESMDDQKRTAVKRIHFLLRQRKASEASALFRAARDVWPEGDVFGSPSLSTTEEVDVIKEIFFYEFSGNLSLKRVRGFFLIFSS